MIGNYKSMRMDIKEAKRGKKLEKTALRKKIQKVTDLKQSITLRLKKRRVTLLRLSMGIK